MFYEGFLLGVLVVLLIWFTNHPLIAYLEVRQSSFKEYMKRQRKTDNEASWGINNENIT